MPELTPDVERELAALDDVLAGRPVMTDSTELGELALLLREQRPEPGPALWPELDARLARGFRDPEPRRRAPSARRWWTPLLSAPALGMAATLLVVVVIVVGKPFAGAGSGAGAGAGAGSGTTSGDQAMSAADEESAGGGATASAPGAAVDGAARSSAPEDAVTSSAEPLPPSVVPPAPGQGSPGSDGRERRSIERSASLTLAARPRDIDAVSARIQDVTRRQGGFVVSSTVNSSAGAGDGTFELRVPARNLDAAMAALSRLGKVRERAQRSQDVTAAVVSARSRLKDARTERKSLLRQLGEATTVTATQAIRARLRIVSAEIEQARAGVRRVSNRAAFSSVSVLLVADASVAVTDDGGTWTPGDAAGDALRVLEVAAGVLLIALAIALPLALLAALAAVAARWSRRRRREHALDAV